MNDLSGQNNQVSMSFLYFFISVVITFIGIIFNELSMSLIIWE